MTETAVLGLLAETFVHVGAGRNEGAIDLPFIREAATDYPFVPGSGVKGALRDRARQHWPDEQETGEDGSTKRKPHKKVCELFGERDEAGQLLVSDARLLLLPVRSLTGAYRWATCPHLLERLGRDLRRSGRPAPDILTVGSREVLTSGQGDLCLEERTFKITGPAPEPWIDVIGKLVPHPEVRGRLGDQLAVLHQDDFTWFARYGLAVQARNVLDPDKKTSDNLWYEETLPPDTLFYLLLARRDGLHAGDIRDLFAERPYLQLGGNETVGQGWFSVGRPDEAGEA